MLLFTGSLRLNENASTFECLDSGMAIKKPFQKAHLKTKNCSSFAVLNNLRGLAPPSPPDCSLI